MISGYSLVAGVALGWLCVIRLCPQNEKTRLTSLAMIVTLRDTSLAILWVQIFLSKKCWVQIWCPKKDFVLKTFGSKHKETTGVCRQSQKLVNCLNCLWLKSFCYFLRRMTFTVLFLWPIGSEKIMGPKKIWVQKNSIPDFLVSIWHVPTWSLATWPLPFWPVPPWPVLTWPVPTWPVPTWAVPAWLLLT